MKPAETTDSTRQFRRYFTQIQPFLAKRKYRASTTVVFSFLAISLFAWYAIRPTAETILYLRKEIEEKTELNRKMEEKITALIEAQANYELVRDKLIVLDESLPRDPDGVLLARQLKNLAASTHTAIVALQLGTLPLSSEEATPGAKFNPPKPLEEFPLTLIVAGTYEQLKAFLEGLGTMRRLSVVDTYTIKEEATSGLDTPLRMVIRLQSYYAGT